MATERSGPDYLAFHKSVSEELYSVKDRIRNLVAHWPTDGEAKEVALRSVLRRHLPQSVIVGRGFIVTAEASSTQVDVLVVDASRPTLFKDGDLLIVTPDAVRGVIEVKTELRNQGEISEALTKLATIEEMCRDSTGLDRVWTGLFAFQGSRAITPRLLEGLRQAHRATARHVNCISCGKDIFVRFWARGRDVESPVRGAVWHAYELRGVAPSYFVGNLIDSIGSVDNSTASFAWFPLVGGKEGHLTDYMPVNGRE